MYQIRKYESSDLRFVENNDSMFALAIQYNRDYDSENVITVMNGNEIVGVAAAAYHNTWYSQYSNVHKLVAEFCTEIKEVMPVLIQGLIDLTKELQITYPKKNIELITFLETTEIEDAQLLLYNGFCYGEVIPVLSYDLTKKIQHYDIPESIKIEEVPSDPAKINNYIDATGKANSQVPDSIAEYYFRSGDPSFTSYQAVCGDEVVGGITIWNISETRAATENIFVVPDYRRKNIASELIATAFEELVNREKKIATLSMSGGNSKAMKLYQKTGYQLMYYLTEFVVK